jgi:hypothetical protein
MERKCGLRCVNVFHAGDGKLHPLILFDANEPEQLACCERFGAESLPPTAPALELDGETLVEWGGAQHWLVSALPAARMRDAATRVGGHATLFRATHKSAGV